MHWIDLSLVILFLVSFSFFGIWQVNKNKSSGDYFLAGKDLPWSVAMFSIVATETSVLTFISVPGLAFRGEWFFLQLGFGYIIGRILVSIFLLPSYFKFGIVSIYEIIGMRYGLFFQKVASLIFLVTRILADGVRFLATAVVVQVITGWSMELAVLIIGAVTLAYTLTGGLRAVIWIDSAQFILYLMGGIISIYVALNYLDMPFNEIITNLSEQAKNMGIIIGLEPVNRYESNLINTASQAMDFIKLSESDNLFIHLDSYHMNIEEASYNESISDCGDKLGYFHIGENHRGYLGTGHINFFEIF